MRFNREIAVSNELKGEARRAVLEGLVREHYYILIREVFSQHKDPEEAVKVFGTIKQDENNGPTFIRQYCQQKNVARYLISTEL